MHRFLGFFTIFSYVVSIGIGPWAHLVEEHADAGRPAHATEFVEYCGGEEDPCNRPDHDHQKGSHSHKACLICKNFSPLWLTVSENSPLQLALVPIFSASFESGSVVSHLVLTSHASRAPPSSLS